MNNGRVATTPGDNFAAYQLFQENKATRPMRDLASDAIKNIHTDNDLARLYFSQQNIDALQQGIRYQVYKKSCGKFTIGNQSETELAVIMRSVYLEHGEFQPFGILEQVRELNARVLEYSVPKIIEEVRLYNQYRKDISQLPVPMERGSFMSAKGTKVLEVKRF